MTTPRSSDLNLSPKQWNRRFLEAVIVLVVFLLLLGLSVYVQLSHLREMAANPFTAEQIERMTLTPCVRKKALHPNAFGPPDLLTPKRLEAIEKRCAQPGEIQREEQTRALLKKS